MAGCCECGDEPSGSCARELVICTRSLEELKFAVTFSAKHVGRLHYTCSPVLHPPIHIQVDPSLLKYGNVWNKKLSWK
jgi:hypothetical protein